MDHLTIFFLALGAVALLIGGAFINHYLEKSKNPKANAVAAQVNAVFDQVDAELAKGAPAIADDVKTAIERALSTMAADEKKAQAEVEAALARQDAVKANNAQAVATIAAAAAPVVQPLTPPDPPPGP